MDEKKEFGVVGDKRFLGSSLAVLIGILALGSGYAGPGWYVILGALAYKSAKKRRLRMVEDAPLRKGLEGVVMILILVGTFLTSREVLVEDPFPYLVLPLWALVAYGIAMGNKPESKAEKVAG